jgi:hypothetical protein
MEAVKRAKPVQKKIVHNILPVLFANTDAFSIRRVKGTYCRRISLFLAARLEAFSYIALCKNQANYTLAYPLRFSPGKRRPQGII